MTIPQRDFVYHAGQLTTSANRSRLETK